MNEKKDNQTIIPPAKSDEETSIVTPNPVALMPQPLNNENLMNISGGDGGERQTPEIDPAGPPEMKVVKLEDGRFVNVPTNAICDTEQDARKFHGKHVHKHRKCKHKHR